MDDHGLADVVQVGHSGSDVGAPSEGVAAIVEGSPAAIISWESSWAVALKLFLNVVRASFLCLFCGIPLLPFDSRFLRRTRTPYPVIMSLSLAYSACPPSQTTPITCRSFDARPRP